MPSCGFSFSVRADFKIKTIRKNKIIIESCEICEVSQFIRFRYISKVVEWIKNKWQWEGNPLNAQCVICLYKIINILRNNSKDSGIRGYVFSRIPLHIKFPYKSRNLSLLKQRKNPSWTNPSNLCNRNLCARQFYSKILSVLKQKLSRKKIADRNF